MSVYKTITTAVLQRFVAARARTALAESIESEDVSGAAAASPDVIAANREGCAATRNFSGRETHPQSCPYRHRNDGDYERRASGHVPGVMKPRADPGQGILSPGGAGIGKKHEWNHSRGISQNTSCGIKEAGGVNRIDGITKWRKQGEISWI